MHGENVYDCVVYFIVPSSEDSCTLRSDVYPIGTDPTLCLTLQERELCRWQWALFMYWH
jgi:hypothetical protein